MSTLSAKFAKLKAPAAANNGGNRPRVQQSIANQQNKRAAQNQARRTGTAPQAVKNNNSAGKRAPRGKPILNGVKKNLRKNGKGAKGAKGGKGKKADTEKKTKSTPTDLDADMDRYWHAAGKGPDPDVAKLDRDMDEYFNKKGAKAAEPAAEAVAMSE